MFSVYVVDDDAMILDEIVQTVPWLDNGFEVLGHHAYPTVALEEILKLRPEVVFTDLKMPGMDGIDLMRRVEQAGLHCEFVMLSAYASFDDSRNFFRMHGFDYLLKPLQQTEVQMVLEQLSERLSKDQCAQDDAHTILPATFLQMTQYIRENYNKKHTLETLGKQFGLSANYICNLFSKHYNTTLTRYITDLRMREALVQIQKSDKALKEIAIESGYGDYYYFCKVFKAFFGESPSKYVTNGTRRGSTP